MKFIELEDGWQIVLYQNGDQLAGDYSQQHLVTQLSSLAETSEYAPPLNVLEHFIVEMFAPSESRSERSLLGVLVDSFGQLQGFIQVRHFLETADLDFIVLNLGVRGRGFANALLGVVFDDLKAHSVERMLLEVGANNHPAASLYKKIGFRKIGLRKAYYKSGEDALVMEKLL